MLKYPMTATHIRILQNEYISTFTEQPKTNRNGLFLRSNIFITTFVYKHKKSAKNSLKIRFNVYIKFVEK